jgi:arylsulfatase A-like enzyme
MKHVIVFGVDGVRTDSLRAAHTPRIDAIEQSGCLSEFELSTDAATMSGPTWATVATGQWPSRHGVFTNNFPDNRLASFPDFLTRVRRKGGKTYLATSWSPLVTTEYGGPIFGSPTRSVFINGDDLDYDAVDEALADDAARVLSTQDIAASFVYLGNPDHVAHHADTTTAYQTAIEAADRQIGRVLDAVRSRTTFPEEQWTTIVVTDHGHQDGGGHGGRSKWERTAWLAACGPGIAAGTQACHIDVAPTVLAALGLPIVSEDGFPGEALAK